MGVSKTGRTVLIFVISGVKINSACYHEVFLTQKLLPVMHEVCGEFFIFQQDNAPAHERMRQSIFRNERHFRSFHATFGPNSPGLNQTKTKFGEKCSSGYGKHKFVKSVN